MSAGPDKLNKALERVIERSDVLLEALKRQQGDDGETFGQLQITGGDFLAYYLDLQSRTIPWPPEQQQEQPDGTIVTIPAGPGTIELRVLDHLRVVSPKLADSLDRQFERELRRQAERVA